MILQIEFTRQKKSRLKSTDGFWFRRWYRALPTATYRR